MFTRTTSRKNVRAAQGRLRSWSPNPHDATIPNLFHSDHIRYWAWWWKLVFTAVTLAAGFKGGEVTPLFFIGAGLGNALSSLLGAPTDLFAALGFVAIFAGASNTPLACTLMCIEPFGAGQTVYIATACFLAYLSSGHSGIYLSQRLAVPKMGNSEHPPDASLRQLREMQPSALHNAIGGLRKRFANRLEPTTNPEEEPSMPHRHKITPKEIGMVRIYLTPRESRKVPGLKGWLSSPPLYHELVNTVSCSPAWLRGCRGCAISARCNWVERRRSLPSTSSAWVFVLVLAAVFLGEKLTWHQWLGGALILTGAIVVALKPA